MRRSTEGQVWTFVGEGACMIDDSWMPNSTFAFRLLE